jgi:putative transposase
MNLPSSIRDEMLTNWPELIDLAYDLTHGNGAIADERLSLNEGDPDMPKGKKHTPEQIVGILRRIEHGETAEAVCREVNISQATLYRWKQQYGALELDEVKELKALREENTQLKRVVADQALNIHVLKIVNAKKW